jgi:peptide/nickel transport system ATP-binding protein
MAYPNPIDPPSGCHFHPRCPFATDLCKTRPPRPVGTSVGHVECHLHDPDGPMYDRRAA